MPSERVAVTDTMTSIAFFGSHPLGEACLEHLADADELSTDLVVTYPRDHDAWWEGSVHERALDLGYPVATIDEEERVLDLPVDYIISVYYPNILGRELLDHPDVAALNLHQAELPRYRGSNVFSHSIMNAREDGHWQHGTTLHVMEPEVDSGAIIDRRFVPITESDTARSLYERTRAASIRLFEAVLPAIATGHVMDMATPQSEFDGKRYFYTKDSLEGEKEIPRDELLGADKETELAIYDKIRALDFPPHEPAWTDFDGRKVYLTASDSRSAET